MVGKRVRGALYIHREAIGHLPESTAASLSDAERRAIEELAAANPDSPRSHLGV